MKSFDLIVNDELLMVLKELNIFQARSGMQKNSEYSYITRYKIGEKIEFERYTSIEEYSTFASGNIFVSSGSFSSLASSLPIGSKIGRYVSLAPGLAAMGFRHPIESVCMNSACFNFSRENIASYFDNYERNNGSVLKTAVPTPQPQNRPIYIGHDVWIGKNVTIMGGINIGNGAVIASNSIVTKNVEPYSIVAGSPAVHKKYRFTNDICKEFEEIQWWEYELGDIYKKGLDFSNPIKFINNFKLLKNEMGLLKVKRFNPYVYKFYGLTESKIIFDEHDNYLCFDIKNKRLVKINLKNKITIKDEFVIPISLEIKTNISFLYLKNYGVINISSELDFDLVCSHEDINYEIIKNISGFSIKINDLYLSSRKSDNFSLMPHLKEWEIFHAL